MLASRYDEIVLCDISAKLRCYKYLGFREKRRSMPHCRNAAGTSMRRTLIPPEIKYEEMAVCHAATCVPVVVPVCCGISSITRWRYPPVPLALPFSFAADGTPCH